MGEGLEVSRTFIGCVLSCIFLFFCKNHAARGRRRERATKTRRGMPPGLLA
jgi:hypothetical protein